jgi:hypothetical protein
VERLQALDASPGHVLDTIGYVSKFTPFDAEVYKYVAQEMVLEAGADLLFHTWIVGAPAINGHITGLEAVNKSGQQVISGDVYVDATGDADVAFFSGAQIAQGRDADGATQPMTMNFRLGGVDLDAVKAYMKAHPEEFYHTTTFDRLDSIPYVTGVSGFSGLWQKAKLPIPRQGVLFFTGVRPGEVGVNTTRIIGLDATKAEDLTKAEIEGRRQVMMLIDFFRRWIPGFENCYLISLPPQVGIRETRRIVGEYVLTGDDVAHARRFPDVAARSAYPIDIHSPVDGGNETVDVRQAHDIPYRCLLPKGVDNLLAAGRIISVTHEAFAAIRVTPPVFAIGQAAGTAAALAVRSGLAPRNVSVRTLQELLVAQGASLAIPDLEERGA